MSFKLNPVNGNIVIEEYEYSEDVKEDESGFMLPESQQKQIDLDKDGIYRVCFTADNVELDLSEGDLIVVPNRTLGEVKMPSGQEMRYVHKDRIILHLEELEDEE